MNIVDLFSGAGGLTFGFQVASEVENFTGLTNSQKSTLTAMVSNKIKGDVVPKNDYIVFISHSREDKIITDFIYHILKYKGAKDSEFFYTSREDNVDQYANPESLAVQIKQNILKDNVLLLYLTSDAYKASEFCMFEGGAGWATRSVGEYIALSLTYPEMPQFITNGKLEFYFEKNKDIPLNRQSYLSVCKMLNNIIIHLNAGRRANAENEIALFEEPNIPSDLELSKNNESIEDYMDTDIKEHWDFYISKNLKTYMDKRYNKEENKNEAS